MHLFSCLLRCLTNAMFLKDKERARLFYDEDGDGMNGTGFFLCEKERMRIVECLSKAQQVLIQ